jgi:RNA polymerase sigma factor (sigma-70 family)
VATPDQSLADPAASLADPTLTAGLEIVAARELGHTDDARDAVQETLARAIEAVRGNRVPPEVPLAAFVYGIARHVIVDLIRRRGRERGPAPEPAAVAAPVTSPLESLIRAEERSVLARALGALRASDRELLELCFLNGERVADIAVRLSEPAERVRKRKSRALERLRQELGVTALGHVSDGKPTSNP